MNTIKDAAIDQLNAENEAKEIEQRLQDFVDAVATIDLIYNSDTDNADAFRCIAKNFLDTHPRPC